MNNFPQLYQLAEALANHIKGSATPDDRSLVDEWLTKSPQNRQLLEKWSDKNFIGQKYATRMLCNTSAVYEKLIKRQKRHTVRRRIMYASVGVAASIVLFWGAALWFSTFSPSSQHDAYTQIIPAGESQAILTLGDGRKIPLGAGRQDTVLVAHEGSITATADHIIYEEIGPGEQIRYDEITLPSGGEYKVTLADGTKVHLNSESSLKFPARFPKGDRHVMLEGEAFFEVNPDPDRPFIVEVNGLNIRVTGTSFNVRAYGDEPYIYATLVSGSVVLETASEKMTLSPGEQGYVNPEDGTMHSREVDLKLYVAWREGRFIFENQPLEEIMSVLKRWYDLHVVFENEAAKRVKFYGNIDRYDDFNKIIEMFDMTGEAKFRIEDDHTLFIK